MGSASESSDLRFVEYVTLNLQENVIELLQLLQWRIDGSLLGCHNGPLYPAGGYKLQSVCRSDVDKPRKERQLRYSHIVTETPGAGVLTS